MPAAVRSTLRRPFIAKAAAVCAALVVASGPAFSAGWSAEGLMKMPCADASKRLNEGLQAGEVEAFRTAGSMFERGVCFDADLRRAAGFYQRAADKGDRASAESLAMLFATGKGVSQDYATTGALLRSRPVSDAEPLTTEDYTRGYAFALAHTLASSIERLQFGDFDSNVAFETLSFRFVPTEPVASLAVMRSPESRLGGPLTRKVAQAMSDAMQKAVGSLPSADAAKLRPQRYRVKLQAPESLKPTVVQFEPDTP